MSTTDNLLITHIEELQNDKYVTANTAFDRLDGATSGSLSIDLDLLSGNQTLTATQSRENLVITASGALSGAVNLIVDSTYKKPYVFFHSGTNFNVTVKTSGGTGVTFTPNSSSWLYCNGTDVITTDPSGVSGTAGVSKTIVTLTGLGTTNPIAIGATVTEASVNVVVDASAYLEKGFHFTVTESGGAGTGYDEITPSDADFFPNGSRVVVHYYSA